MFVYLVMYDLFNDTLSILNGRMISNDELDRVCNDVVEPYTEALSGHMPGRTEEYHHDIPHSE